MKTWSFLIVLGVLIAAGAADAATYRWMGPDGVVIYSDRPPQPGDLPKAAAAEAPAPAARAGARGAVDDLLARSGFKDQVAAIADRLRTEFHRRHGHLVAPDMTLAREISSARLRPEALYEAFVVEFAKRIDEERMADALVWFDSPAGRKIAGLEGRAARARDGAAELGRFVARLRGEPTRPERVALVQRLDAAGRATENSIEASLSLLRSLAVAVSPYLPLGQGGAPGEVEGLIQRVRAQALSQTRQMSWVMMLFAYRQLSDPELTQYVEFAESGPGQWYLDAVGRSFVEAVGAVTRGAAAELVEAVPPARWHLGPEPREAPRPAASL